MNRPVMNSDWHPAVDPMQKIHRLLASAEHSSIFDDSKCLITQSWIKKLDKNCADFIAWRYFNSARVNTHSPPDDIALL